VAGRLASQMDPRLLIAAGVVLMTWSLLRLSGWTPAIGEWSLFFDIMIQGAGLGLVFVPLNVVSFATLPVRLRYEGTAVISLSRNVGSSIGISVFEALLTRGAAVEHSALAPFASPLNRALSATPGIANALSPATPHGAALLNQMIDYQSQVIAYNNDYWLMGLMALPILLMLPFVRRPQASPGEPVHAAMD